MINVLNVVESIRFENKNLSEGIRVIQTEELVKLMVDYYNREHDGCLGDVLSIFENKCGMLNVDAVWDEYYPVVESFAKSRLWDRRIKMKCRFVTKVIPSATCPTGRKYVSNIMTIEMDLDKTIDCLERKSKTPAICGITIGTF